MIRRSTSTLLFALSLALGCTGAAPPKQPQPTIFEAQSAGWLFEQGRRRAEAGDSVRAEQYLASAVRRGYDESRALPLLLRVCLDGQRLRSALNYAEPYVRRHPERLTLRQLVATLHLALGQLAEARAELEGLLRQAPQFAEAHYLLAVIQSNFDRDDEAARAHYEAYLELAPAGRNRPEARSWLADHALGEARTRPSAAHADETEPKEAL